MASYAEKTSPETCLTLSPQLQGSLHLATPLLVANTVPEPDTIVGGCGE